MIHPLSDVQTTDIGTGTKVWQFTTILPGAKIGKNCNLNCHVFVENDVLIGDNVTVKSGVYLWDGLRIEDHVFIGPNVTFTNDRLPRSKQFPSVFQKTFIGRGSSIGAAATVLGGLRIGEYAMVGAGSVVTSNVPDRALVIGTPARIVGWVNTDGSKMKNVENTWVDCEGKHWVEIENKLELI